MTTQKVTDKILADANEEAKQILAKYKEEATSIDNDYAQRTGQKKKQIEDEVTEIKKTAIMRAVSQKRLELNRNITQHKQALIKSIIEDAVTRLIGHKDYPVFLKTLIKDCSENEGELLLSNADIKRHRDDLEKYLRKEGLNLKISAVDDLKGGIIIRKEKTNYLGSLHIILELMSDELAIVVSKELF